MTDESDDHEDDDKYISQDYGEDGMDYDPDSDEDDELDNNDEDDMNESRIYEIALDEYDSHVGYTDNYQSKDPLKSSLPVADSKDSDDWGSQGLRDRGNGKPWSGKKNNAKENQPFTGAKGKTVEEEDDAEDNTVEESAAEMGGKMGAHARMTGTKFHQAIPIQRILM